MFAKMLLFYSSLKGQMALKLQHFGTNIISTWRSAFQYYDSFFEKYPWCLPGNHPSSALPSPTVVGVQLWCSSNSKLNWQGLRKFESAVAACCTFPEAILPMNLVPFGCISYTPVCNVTIPHLVVLFLTFLRFSSHDVIRNDIQWSFKVKATVM